MKSFIELKRAMLDRAARLGPKRLVLAGSENKAGLQAAIHAYNEGLVIPVLVGNAAKTRELCDDLGLDVSGLEIHDAPDASETARAAVALVREEKADILLKGSLSSSDYLRPVVDKETGISKGGLLSNIAIIEAPGMNKFLFLSDCGMILCPTLEEKVKMIGNAVVVAEKFGIKRPKVAVVCATEEVTPRMPATQEAAELTLMNRDGRIGGCVVDGPLAFDLAVSPEAVKAKGVISEVAGDAE